jgi:uncharacterized damage-inducible protein DinB
MSTVIDPQGRPEPPMAAGEVATLLGFLEFQRATLAWKCAGLNADALQTQLKPSSMTLGGMLTHLAWVEDYWFTSVLFDRPMPPPWQEVDWTTDPDWDWRIADDRVPDDLHTWWAQAKDRSRAVTTEALSAGGLEFLARRPRRDGSTPCLRWVLVHMIEEYARHNGHADLLREAIDGQTGE